MKTTLRMSTLTTSLLMLLLLAGCHKDSAEPIDDGLEGHWKLTNRQCYCPSTAVPNETVSFSGTNFAFYNNGQLASSGTYLSAIVSSGCGGGSAAGLRLITAAGVQEVAVERTGNTLTLDYGGPCDAPVDTYERLP